MSRATTAGCGRSPTAWAAMKAANGRRAGSCASSSRIDLPTDFEAGCEAAAQAIARRQPADPRRGHASAASRWARPSSCWSSRATRYAVLWVGDSRAYLLRGGKLVQLSRDHTQVQEMVDRGLMTAEQAHRPSDGPHPVPRRRRAGGGRGRPRRRRGPARRHLPALQRRPARLCRRRGDRAPFARDAPERALDELVELTLETGAPDNVTGDRRLGQRADPSLLCGSKAMSDDKDKNAQGTPPAPDNQEAIPARSARCSCRAASRCRRRRRPRRRRPPSPPPDRRSPDPTPPMPTPPPLEPRRRRRAAAAGARRAEAPPPPAEPAPEPTPPAPPPTAPRPAERRRDRAAQATRSASRSATCSTTSSRSTASSPAAAWARCSRAATSTPTRGSRSR